MSGVVGIHKSNIEAVLKTYQTIPSTFHSLMLHVPVSSTTMDARPTRLEIFLWNPFTNDINLLDVVSV
jgi:hypothetical protein